MFNPIPVVLYAPVAVSTAGAHVIVDAVPGMKIFVLGYWLSAVAAVNTNWQNHVSYSTNPSGLHYLGATSSVVANFYPAGIYATSLGEGLDLNISGSVGVGGGVAYVVSANQPSML